ncbi:MAG: hypothetical protein QT02_C0001G0100 [archaeon GW2011_AR9]|nr:MAG: hypothetical protein QT02_C0001G0100 [archaeon GW2011_AR9]
MAFALDPKVLMVLLAMILSIDTLNRIASLLEPKVRIVLLAIVLFSEFTK